MHCDYHLHSEFSFDSSEKIENICKKAVEEGISEIAVTDHAELPLRENAPWPDFERRAEIIRVCSAVHHAILVVKRTTLVCCLQKLIGESLYERPSGLRCTHAP